MAHLKNWKPNMTLSEQEWFDKCPKAVLFEIARQFGMRIADDFSEEAAFDVMQNEWDMLHQNGIVPQKPKRPRTDAQIIEAMHPVMREKCDRGAASATLRITGKDRPHERS